MKSFFRSYGDGFPFFIYYLSLFITTCYFTLLCYNIYSLLVFVVASILYLSVKASAAKTCPREGAGAFLLNITAVIAFVFSLFAETGIAVNIFGLASDADSGRAELSFFAAIVCIFAFIIAIHRINTLRSLACLGVIIPFAVLLPCSVALARFGAGDILDLIKTDDFFGDILRGLAAFSVSVSDIGVVYECSVSEKKCNAESASLWARGAVIFISVTTLLLGMLFGRNMNIGLSSSLLSSAGLTGGMGFNEVLLIVFAFCMILRLGMKMIFIFNDLMRYIQKRTGIWTITLLLAVCSASAGAFIVTKSNISDLIYAQAILNLAAFIIIPFISKIPCDKNKS